MEKRNFIRLGDIFLVRKSNTKFILEEKDSINPKLNKNSFPFYNLSFILDDYNSYINKKHNSSGICDIMISEDIFDNWQLKIREKEIQNYIDTFLKYLDYGENIRLEAREKIKNKLLNNLSLEEFILTFGQSEPGKN